MIVRFHRLATAGAAAAILGCTSSPSSTAPAPAAAPEPTPVQPVASGLPLKHAPTPTEAAITSSDLMTRLYIYADDSLEGRLGGTRGNFKATAYIAGEARRLGLEAAGTDGYFQNIPLVDRAYDESSTFGTGATTFTAWRDFLPRDQGTGRPIDGARVIFGGTWGDSASLISLDQARGRFVVLRVAPGPDGKPRWSTGRGQTTARFQTAAGIAVASLSDMPEDQQRINRPPSPRFGADTTTLPTFMYVTADAAARLLGGPLLTARPGAPGATVRGRITFRDSVSGTPARNVVAILRGSDPALRGQFVAIGAHNDHIGIQPPAVDHDSLRAFNTVMRPGGAEDNPGTPTAAQTDRIQAIRDSLRLLHPARLDSIANGADDDGSGTVTVLEIAEWLAGRSARPRRSILFVWHTGEELGLLGSSWYTDHPTVPRDSIVAQLNIDMVGRGGPADVPNGGPGYLQLIGSRRLSTELGDIVEAVNRSGSHGFTFDYQYDTNGNPHQYYCRSDHYEYARYGIPITFFTTGGHRDYHQVTDEPQYIDYVHMARVAALVGDIAVHLADLDHRIVVDKPKPDPYGVCQQ